MFDLVPLTTPHKVGTREFVADVWYALREAYSARHRATSIWHTNRTTRSIHRDRLKLEKQAATRAREQESISPPASSPSTNITRSSRNISSQAFDLGDSTTPSSSFEHEVREFDTTSDDDYVYLPTVLDSGLSESLQESHIDPRILDQTQDSSAHLNRIYLEPVISRKGMTPSLIEARRIAGRYYNGETTSNSSIDDLIDGFTYR